MELSVTQSFKPTDLKIPWRWSLLLLVVFALASPFDLSQSGGRLTPEQDTLVSQVENGNAAREIALLSFGLLSSFLLFKRGRGHLQVNGFLGWAVIFYVALAVASPVWAEDSSLAIRRVGVLIVLSLGALATVERLSLIRTAALAVCVCGLTLLVSVGTELGLRTFNPLDESWRFSGVLHPVTQGWNCGLLAMSSLALAWALPRKRGRLILLALVGLVFLGLTRSRMPFISTILATVVLGIFISRKTRKATLVLMYVVLVCMGYLWFAMFVRGLNVAGTATNIAAMGRGEEAASSLDTFTGRLPLWDEELSYVRARPILGYGYNAFFNPRNLESVSDALGWVPTSPHSGYIGTLLGLGLLGAAAFLCVLISALKRSLNLAWGNLDASYAAAVTIWLCCNLLLESTVIAEPSFPAFICMVVLGSLAFRGSSHFHRLPHKAKENTAHTLRPVPSYSVR